MERQSTATTSPTSSSLEESVADIERSVADIQRSMAKFVADVERAVKAFCVQEGKGECVDKVGAWAAACSGLDKIKSWRAPPRRPCCSTA